MEQFFCNTKILTGDAIQAVRELGAKRLLVVTDPFFRDNGMAARLAEAAPAGRIFGEVTPDPTVELVARGAAVVREFDPDTVLALGGGSAMDCAKAMVSQGEKAIRLVAVPTTSGSGSEVTDFAVLTHGTVKYPLVDEALRPQVAILDAGLLTKLPRSLVADGGFDVLAHALEALVATGAGAITDALAKDAFLTAFSLLPASFSGDVTVRGRIHSAATMAGIAFSQAGLGLCHGLSHSLGGMFHIPHGRLNGILLPAVVEHNAPACGGKYAALARAAGLSAGAERMGVRNLKNALCRLRQQLGLPRDLVSAGVDGRQVRHRMEELIRATLADPCCGTNPAPVTGEDVRRILQEVTGRG